MIKKNKINQIKQMLKSAKVSPLSEDEIEFLKNRKAFDCVSNNKVPLIIKPIDNDETVKKILLIAEKLGCPCIRFVRSIVGEVKIVPGIVTIPKAVPKKVIIPKEKINTLEAEPVIEEVTKEEATKEVTKKVYRLKFPSVWHDEDDDSDMVLKVGIN